MITERQFLRIKMEGKRKIFITFRMYCKFFKEALKNIIRWLMYRPAVWLIYSRNIRP